MWTYSAMPQQSNSMTSLMSTDWLWFALHCVRKAYKVEWQGKRTTSEPIAVVHKCQLSHTHCPLNIHCILPMKTWSRSMAVSHLQDFWTCCSSWPKSEATAGSQRGYGKVYLWPPSPIASRPWGGSRRMMCYIMGHLGLVLLTLGSPPAMSGIWSKQRKPARWGLPVSYFKL